MTTTKQYPDELQNAAQALLNDVRRRYPGQDLYCPYLISLDKALENRKAAQS